MFSAFIPDNIVFPFSSILLPGGVDWGVENPWLQIVALLFHDLVRVILFSSPVCDARE